MAQQVYRGRSVVVSFAPDKAGIAEIAVGPRLRAAVGDIVTTRALPYAMSISPVGGGVEDTHPGAYVSSFEVNNDAHAVIAGMRRVACLLLNNSDHAAAVEWGNEHLRNPHRVLGKTIDHLNSGA